jgi:hypothetical protein
MLTSLLRVNLLQNLQCHVEFFRLGSSKIREMENSDPNRRHTLSSENSSIGGGIGIYTNAAIRSNNV